jgi:hypothetical protein
MLRSILSTLITFTLIFAPVVSYAGDETSSEDIGDQAELVTTITQGQPAPFSGTLFSTRAAATLLAELEMNNAACQILIDREVATTTASFQLEVGNLNATITRLQTNHDSILAIKNDQIDYLDLQLGKASKPNRELWFALGVVGGVLITGTAAWGLGQIEAGR